MMYNLPKFDSEKAAKKSKKNLQNPMLSPWEYIARRHDI